MNRRVAGLAVVATTGGDFTLSNTEKEKGQREGGSSGC